MTEPCKKGEKIHPGLEFCGEHRELRTPDYGELLPVRLHMLDEAANRDNFQYCGWARRFYNYVSQALRSPVA